MGVKCRKCRIEKEPEQFAKIYRDGPPTNFCKACKAAKRRDWAMRNPGSNRRSRRKFQLALYGLTEADYAAMLEAQGGVCAICRQGCSTGKLLAVDHDHETGIVRGLLCQRCNRMVGTYEASRASVEEYLRLHREGSPALKTE